MTPCTQHMRYFHKLTFTWTRVDKHINSQNALIYRILQICRAKQTEAGLQDLFELEFSKFRLQKAWDMKQDSWPFYGAFESFFEARKLQTPLGIRETSTIILLCFTEEEKS